MRYEMEYDDTLDCVVCRIFGELRSPDVLDVGTKAAVVLRAHDCRRLLNDLRGAEHHLSLVDIYNLPKMSGEFGFPPRTKRAFVFSEDAKDLQFFETVSVNRGQLVKICKNMDEALAWLTG